MHPERPTEGIAIIQRAGIDEINRLTAIWHWIIRNNHYFGRWWIRNDYSLEPLELAELLNACMNCYLDLREDEDAAADVAFQDAIAKIAKTCGASTGIQAIGSFRPTVNNF